MKSLETPHRHPTLTLIERTVTTTEKKGAATVVTTERFVEKQGATSAELAALGKLLDDITKDVRSTPTG